jgi:hypothetical protein
LAAACVVGASAAYFWGTNLADEDLWNHLNFGTLKLRTLAVPRLEAWSYSAAGHPWFNHEWGAEVVFAWLHGLGGAPALIALKALSGLVVLAAMLDAARTLVRADGSRAHPLLTAAVLVVACAALGPGASFRPQLFTMMGLAVAWCLLLRADARLWGDDRRWGVGWEVALVPLVLLVWTNAHGGFPVGVAVHGVFILGVLARALAARIEGEPVPPASALVAVAASGVATLAATVVNPYGAGLHRYLATTLADHARITEWMPLPIVSTSHLPFEVLTLATIACAVPWTAARPHRSARLDWRLAFLGLALVSALQHRRHSVLFVIVAAPVAIAAGEHVRRRLLARIPALAPRRPVLATIAAGALGVAGFQMTSVAARYAESGLAIRYAREEFPADAVAFLRAHGVGGNVAAQFEWGGYTLLHLGATARVFIDGRYEAAYPPQVIDDYFAFFEGGTGWARVLDAYPTDVVMLEPTAAVIPLLDARPDLVRVYADPTAVVYLRRTPANAAVLSALTAVAARPPTSPAPTYFP